MLFSILDHIYLFIIGFSNFITDLKRKQPHIFLGSLVTGDLSEVFFVHLPRKFTLKQLQENTDQGKVFYLEPGDQVFVKERLF